MTRVDADIEALKEFHAALIRFRDAQREVAARGGDEVEAARVSLAERAGHWRSVLEQRQAELDLCRRRAAQAPTMDDLVDCAGYAYAVAEAEQRLEQIRRWQQRVEEEASVFVGVAGRFRNLLENDLPRTQAHLSALITRLEDARGVQPPSS
ncbi:MAG TPA: hypothetical protein VF070_26025 [Streptosporangiaceae bacterium]